MHCLRVDVYDKLELLSSSHAYFGESKEECLGKYRHHLLCDPELQKRLRKRTLEEHWVLNEDE